MEVKTEKWKWTKVTSDKKWNNCQLLSKSWLAGQFNELSKKKVEVKIWRRKKWKLKRELSSGKGYLVIKKRNNCQLLSRSWLAAGRLLSWVEIKTDKLSVTTLTKREKTLTWAKKICKFIWYDILLLHLKLYMHCL